ncbi:MAG: BamA/OMP85 family outer membrane protein, partial [Planctomycetota bacterium]
MQNTILIVLILAVLLSVGSGCASTAGREKSQTQRAIMDSDRRDIIKSVEFVNNRKYKDKTLNKKVDIKPGGYLDLVLIRAGRETIAEFYRKKGFAYVQVKLDEKKLSEGRVVYVITEGPRPQIKSVRFKGNKGIKTGDLKKTIKTSTRRWLLWPAYYTAQKVAVDVEKLRNLYYRRGFLNHRIGVEGQSHIVFVIVIEEGPLYKVRNIIVAGNTHFDNEAVLAELELESGKTYYQLKAEAHVKRILKLYREKGFVDVQVRQRPWFVPDANVVDVEFQIVEGSQFRIGRIDITGNEQTQDKVVRRVLDEYDFTPGQLYNADMAPKQGGGQLERYVQGMALAQQVIIKPVVPPDEAEDRRDVKVDITEGLTGTLNPGVAVGSDAGIIGQLILEQRNFDITDWPESFGDFVTMNAFKGAGQNLRVALEPGTEVSYYSVTFTEPYFRDKPTSLNVAGSSYERWRESYDEKRIKGSVGFKKRLKNRWRPSLGFRVENVEVVDLEYDAPQEIIDVKGYNLLMGARLGIGRDLSDDIYTPSAGHRYNVSYEQVTGDHDFGILEGTCVGYRTLYEDLLERKTVLAMKLLAATTESDAPPFEKFYAGGTGKYGIRGFDYRGVSTRGLQTNVANPIRKDPIGSDWIFLANTEVTVPLIGENISALFFIDSG